MVDRAEQKEEGGKEEMAGDLGEREGGGEREGDGERKREQEREKRERAEFHRSRLQSKVSPPSLDKKFLKISHRCLCVVKKRSSKRTDKRVKRPDRRKRSAQSEASSGRDGAVPSESRFSSCACVRQR